MNELLDRAKARFGSDRKVALFLGISPQYIANIRHGRGALQPYHAAKIAEAIGERWYDSALPALAASARTDEERSYWQGKLRGLHRSVAGIALAAAASMIPAPGDGTAGAAPVNGDAALAQRIDYATSRRRRRGRPGRWQPVAAAA